jgi:hypothetical protein
LTERKAVLIGVSIGTTRSCEEPFRSADRVELEAECRRITNGDDFHYGMKRNGDRYEHVVRFAS